MADLKAGGMQEGEREVGWGDLVSRRYIKGECAYNEVQERGEGDCCLGVVPVIWDWSKLVTRFGGLVVCQFAAFSVCRSPNYHIKYRIIFQSYIIHYQKQSVEP